MTASRIALVTGANQGLGHALVEGLGAGMAPHDRVLLTGRDAARVEAAAAIAAGPAIAHVEGRVLDVRDPAAIAALAAELGEVDIVFSNATARMSPDADPVDEVDAVAETSDLAHNKLVMALCPGLIDTDASRPWFDDMSQALTPAQAAVWPVALALAPQFDPAFYGELVQFGKVLPWTSGIPVAHSATT